MRTSRLLPPGVVSALRPIVIKGRRLAQGRRRINLSKDVSYRLLGSTDHHTFFGYYDLSPFEPDGDRLLSCRVRRDAPNGPMEIGFYATDAAGEDRFTAVTSTATWCWQQGCRFAWAPQLGKGCVLYNALGPTRFEAVLFDLDSRREIARFPRPLYDLASSGRYGLSLNFARLQRLRPGYGYANLPDTTADEGAPAGDGLWLVDLQSGESRLLHSLAEIAETEPQKSMAGATHYFNHVSWNPSGSRFLFFHIWEHQGERRKVRLLTSDAKGAVRVVTNDELVSHYCWIDENRMLLYAEFERVRGYYEVADLEAGRRIPERCEALPLEDGHPTWCAAAGKFLLDSLPDRLSERSLMTFRPGDERPRLLGSFYSPVALTGEARCDLHPRWSRDGRQIAIDTAHDGFRQMAVVAAPPA